MYTISEIKNLLFDAVIQKDIIQVALIAYQTYQKPVLILDMNSFVLAQIPEHPIGNQFYDEILEAGRVPYSYYEPLMKDSVFDYTYHKRDIVYLNWGLHEDTPHFYAPVIIDGFLVSGITFICEKGFEPQAYDYEVIEMFAKAISVFVEKAQSCHRPGNSYLTAQLFIENHISQDNKKSLLKYFKIDPSKSMCIMVAQLRRSSSHNTSIFKYVCQYIEGNTLNTITLTMEEKLIILFYNMNNSFCENQMEGHTQIEEVVRYLIASEFDLGLSQTFSQLEMPNITKNRRHWHWKSEEK